MNIRDILTNNPFVLGPMAGWTDVFFRHICKGFGAGVTCTEMVSAQGLRHGNDKTWEYIEVSPREDAVVVQLFGHDPDVIAEQAVRVRERVGDRLAAIDINMGCPVRKVVRNGEGSALMTTPGLASRIVERTSSALDAPLTVKFRRGFERGEETCVEFAKAMEAAGAAACCVHGRFARDFYGGKADWSAIARVKEAVSIPVVASGDIFSADDAVRCLRQTGADGVMIARGAQGNPWIFAQATRLAAGEASFEVDFDERIRVMREHAKMLDERGGRFLVRFRTYAPAYMKGLAGAARLRDAASRCKTMGDLEALFELAREMQRGVRREARDGVQGEARRGDAGLSGRVGHEGAAENAGGA